MFSAFEKCLCFNFSSISYHKHDVIFKAITCLRFKKTNVVNRFSLPYII